MNNDIFLLSLHEIQKRFERSIYVKPVKQQLAKDLFVLGEEFNLLEKCEDFTCIFQTLTKVLKKYIENNKTGLMNFLYRVDVSEKRISKALDTSKENADELLAELVIKRELQKVLFREKFS